MRASAGGACAEWNSAEGGGGLIVDNSSINHIICGMKRLFFKAILTLAALLSGFSAIQAETVVGFDLDSIPREIGYPKVHKYGIIARHQAYSMQYLQKYQLVYWLAYTLTKETLAGPHKSVYELGADPMTFTGFAEPGDYKGSGYVPGFLMPVDFASWDSTARREGFYMTNTTPQKRGFNKGVWKKMEALERTWVEQGARLWAVAGPIVRDSTRTIGANKVRIPTYFFKVFLIEKAGKFEEAAFLFLNEATGKPPENFLVSVDWLESMTGYDFFPMLPDSLENALESRAARITF